MYSAACVAWQARSELVGAGFLARRIVAISEVPSCLLNKCSRLRDLIAIAICGSNRESQITSEYSVNHASQKRKACCTG